MKKIIFILVLFAFILTPKVFAVSDEFKIKDYRGEANFSVYLSESNELYAVGSNNNGQLGIGYKSEGVLINPQDKPIMGNVKLFETGKSNFVIAVTIDNKIFGWGSNQYGQLAQGVTTQTRGNDLVNPTQIRLDNDNAEIIKVALGARHTMILDSNGDIWVFGESSYGQLGTNKEIQNRQTVYGTPEMIDKSYFNNQKVIDISASDYTSYAVLENGDVYAWGTDYNGQLILGDNPTVTLLGTTEKMINYPVKTLFENITKISSRAENVMVQDRNGKIFVGGSNTLKQLGVKDFTENFTNKPLEITEAYTSNGESLVFDVVDFKVGGVSNFLLLADGSLVSFGAGGGYELGYALTTITSEYLNISSVIAPTKVTFYQTIDIESVEDEVEQDKLPLDKSKIIDVNIIKILHTSGDRTFVLDDENNVWSFGSNSNGMLGVGNLSLVDAPVLSTLYRVRFYDTQIIRKNYLIEPLIGVSVILVLIVIGIVFLEINLKKARLREQRALELLKSINIK